MKDVDEQMNLAIGVIRKRTNSEPALRGATAFAAALAGRYAADAISVSGVDRALAYEPASHTKSFYNVSHINVASVVNVHQHVPETEVDREMRLPSTPSAGLGQAQAEVLFERLFSRRARVASFAAGASSAIPRANDIVAPILRSTESAGKPLSIERVVHRTPVNDAAPEPFARAKAAPAPGTDNGWGTPAVPPPAQPAATLPAPDIRRVADQVMREIDHRLVAQRERMGRR